MTGVTQPRAETALDLGRVGKATDLGKRPVGCLTQGLQSWHMLGPPVALEQARPAGAELRGPDPQQHGEARAAQACRPLAIPHAKRLKERLFDLILAQAGNAEVSR